MTKKKKTKEEKYVITPKGLYERSLSEGKHFWDTLELYCFRHEYNGIVIEPSGSMFVKLEKRRK